MASLAWASWHCRNMSVFEQTSFNAVEVAKGWVKLVQESNVYAAKVFNRAVPLASRSGNSWHCPDAGVVKINCDAHLGAESGLGVVFRIEQGSLLAAAVRKEGGGWDVEVAEVAACRFGLLLARRLGYSQVQLECDAERVVRAINSKAVGFSPIYLLYEDIN
ncbi:uncharacterized protein LOC110698619 [Chenopodium quinoa]|uniref:uncharacterized protein LOC110698619 n=1 Tax=Chenopodium quinoa TaxID=63459 RepID=UPI000B771F15|nr:uncharacterized protein LOC110698619 [Chenopodium quinoa]XP_021731788.1 uncharacterized protein LOC110698619 [Chenopodium quinoa]